MTQRIFDMENEQDVKDLFDILPDSVYKISVDFETGLIDTYYPKGGISRWSLPLKIDWHNNIKEVYRPVDKSKWIGCLCLFKNLSQKGHVGILKNIDDFSKKYVDEYGFNWTYCRPVKRDEIQFVEDGE